MIKYFNKNMNNNFIRNLKPKSLFRLIISIIPLFIILISISCEEERNSLGADLMPDGDKINYYYDTTIEFIGNVYEREPYSTTNLDLYPIGVIDDYWGGVLDAKYVGQFYPEKFTDDLDVENINIDSAYFYLSLDTIFGSEENDIDLNVYRIDIPIDEDSTYYSDFNFDNFFLMKRLISTNSKIQGDSLLSFKLDEEYYKLFTLSGDDINSSDSVFDAKFKGIGIETNSYSNEGKMFIANFKSDYSRIVLYYNDTLELNYNFEDGKKVGCFNRDYNSGKVNDYLTNEDSLNDEYMFYQRINGISSKIKINDYLKVFNPDSLYTIINAELIVPIFKDENYNNYPKPNNFYLYYHDIDSDSTLVTVEDYGADDYGGYYDNIASYRFNITQHLKNLIKGEVKDSYLNIAIKDTKAYPYRVIFKSGDEIKLKVTYTKH